MGTIRERRPGHYELRAYVGRSPAGTPRFIQETYVSKRKDTGSRAAEDKLKELERKAKAKKVETTSFGALLDDWLDFSEKIGRSPTTMRSYRIKSVAIKEALGSIQLDVLATKDVDRWYGELLAGGTSPAMVRHYHRIISAALRRGRRWGAVATNVAEDAEKPRVPRFELAPPAPDRVEALIRLALASRARRMGGIIMWAALTGMRRGEICGLRWHDVLDWELGRVSVRRAVYSLDGFEAEKDTKTHQNRELTVSAEALAVLVDRRDRARTDAAAAGLSIDADGYVWSADLVGVDPMDPDRVTQAFSRLCRKAEEPALKALLAKREGATRGDLATADRWDYRFHDLRHFAASQLLTGGHDVVTVSKMLGHERPSTTTDIYGHGVERASRAAADHLGSLLRGALMPAESPK